MSHSRFDHLVQSTYLQDLDRRSLDELRGMRQECEQAEAAFSFTRRVMHGRLDLVRSERERRRAGLGAGTLTDLVTRMPAILAAHPGPSQPRAQRLVVTPAPGCVSEDLIRRIDEVVGPEALAALPGLPDDEVDRLAERLGDVEAELSSARRCLHGNIDALQQEITTRYRRGEATIEGLLNRG